MVTFSSVTHLNKKQQKYKKTSNMQFFPYQSPLAPFQILQLDGASPYMRLKGNPVSENFASNVQNTLDLFFFSFFLSTELA